LKGDEFPGALARLQRDVELDLKYRAGASLAAGRLGGGKQPSYDLDL
jgi:hypothetical protein